MSDDHDHPSPEQEAAMARDALAKGDLGHAIHHIGCALIGNPTSYDWLGVLAQIVQRSPDPLGLVPVGGDTNFVTAATRGYILAMQGKWEEAIDLVGQVVVVRPDVPYLHWVEWWVAQPGVLQGFAFDQLAPMIVVPAAKLAGGCPPATPSDDPRYPNLQAAARLVHMVRGLHPNESFGYFTGSMLSRRLGMFDDALLLAQHAYQLEPSWRSAIGVANTYKDMGRPDDAITWFRKALSHDPEDVSAHLDIGDTLLKANRLNDAIAEYEKVLKKQDGHPWAKASIHYAKFKLTGDPKERLYLIRMTEADEGSERASDLCAELEPPVPYVTWLPRPGDASCNALNHIFEQMFDNPAQHHGSTVVLELSHVESPSVVAAFFLQMEMWGPQVGFDYRVRKIQQPDPRQPKAQVEFQLWRWEGNNGTQPRAAMARPGGGPSGAGYGSVGREIYAIAEEPFHLDIWTPIAEQKGRELGPGRLNDLLALMVNPPRPPNSTWRVLNWTQRFQVACALTIAHLDAGWPGSVRQRALYSLVYGPTDWTTTAGIIALGVLARKEPAIRAEVEQVYGWLRSQIPAEGFCCWAYPLACTWLALGKHDDITRTRLEQWKQELYEEVGKSTVHMVEIEAKKFDFEEEKAKAQAAAQQIAGGGGGDPDPMVFPGQPVAKLSDYVRLMKVMQTGNMMGALQQYGLDMMAYAQVATAWGQKLAADPVLNAKFSQMMQS
ncbi:MAG TPA: tetratricopeptide repeat protein [Kofleriaceae bacterium]|nr:tetratricopeptide repeat protein [Kofleriaceae bacterium]